VTKYIRRWLCLEGISGVQMEYEALQIAILKKRGMEDKYCPIRQESKTTITTNDTE